MFEFQRFIDIAKYLSPSLIESNIITYTNDSKRLTNRSLFWSNYDERFSSVKIWVKDSDFNSMNIDKPVSLNGIKIVKQLNTEVCVLEFKDANILLVEFFRLKDKNRFFHSLIFDSDIENIKKYISNSEFNLNLYDQLEAMSNYKIKHIKYWQGFVDKFLRNHNIYPNNSILNSSKFNMAQNFTLTYKKMKVFKNQYLKQIKMV